MQGCIMKTCKIENCELKVYALGYCRKHYERFHKYGDPLKISPIFNHDDICSISGCSGKYASKGFCNKHYQRFLTHGDPNYCQTEFHGMHETQEYNTWAGMIQRCNNKNHKEYHRYGGRGIIVCESWGESFLSFFADMGLKPFSKAQIDRIDNDGNYEPGNCRWVTPKENCQNRGSKQISSNCLA